MDLSIKKMGGPLKKTPAVRLLDVGKVTLSGFGAKGGCN
jgi:hypothetical protein